MDWSAPIDIYCERMGPEFWAEPINAITNAAFLIAALVGAGAGLRAGLREPILWVLIALAALIGVGSFLFHTHATVWAALSDVAPIWLFVALYLYAFATKVAGIGRLRLLIGTAVALVGLGAISAGIGAALGPARAALNGSDQYAPALLALGLFSVLLWRRGHPLAKIITTTTAIFALSLSFRTLDAHICPALPLGTHYLWHILNAVVIGLLLVTLVRGLAASR